MGGGASLEHARGPEVCSGDADGRKQLLHRSAAGGGWRRRQFSGHMAKAWGSRSGRWRASDPRKFPGAVRGGSAADRGAAIEHFGGGGRRSGIYGSALAESWGDVSMAAQQHGYFGRDEFIVRD